MSSDGGRLLMDLVADIIHGEYGEVVSTPSQVWRSLLSGKGLLLSRFVKVSRISVGGGDV
jgi:hypothetical protein